MPATKTAFIRARVAPTLKRDAERVLRSLGMDTSNAISMFLTQVSLQQGLPFAVNIPNETTVAALRAPLSRKGYKNSSAMLSAILGSK